jgi:hypothetical protein
MKMLISKYKTRIHSLFLGTYLFTLIVGVIHHHNYEYCITDAIETERNPIANHFQNLGGNSYECIIQQNFINLQTAVIEHFIADQCIKYNIIFFESYKTPLNICSVHLTENHLRAPPSLS